MRKRLFYILPFLVFSPDSNAQNSARNVAPAADVFKHITPLYFFHNLNLTKMQPTAGSSSMIQHARLSKISSGSINDMPFFCAMECRLREHTRLWIKFRTGDDASYEKLIRSGKK